MRATVDASSLALPGRLEESSIALQAGQLACLVGPNGSGKTSLLHALAGIGGPLGEVRIDGIDPKALGPKQRMRLLSYLPASRDVRWPLTARDLVALGCAGPEDQARIPQLLDELACLPLVLRLLRLAHRDLGGLDGHAAAQRLLEESHRVPPDLDRASLGNASRRALQTCVIPGPHPGDSRSPPSVAISGPHPRAVEQ